MQISTKKRLVKNKPLFLMRMTGVEPARHQAQEPKSCAYANFATSADIKLKIENGKLKIIV